MEHKFLARGAVLSLTAPGPWLVGASLAAAAVLVTPSSAAAASSPTPSAHHATASAVHQRSRAAQQRAAVTLGGCVFDQSGTVLTLTSDCAPTGTIRVPDGDTLDGAGRTLTVTGAFDGPVVTNDGTSMSIRNLNVTGSGLTGCRSFDGILFSNASGSLNNVHVKGITMGNGCQGVIGIRITATGTHRTVTVTNSSSSGSQKGELVVSGDVTADVSGSTFGPGDFLPLVIAQNAVQYSFGAGGTFTGNKVLGTTFGGASGTPPVRWASTGMLLWSADNLTISNNTFGGDGTDVALFVTGPDAGPGSTGITIENNTIARGPTPEGFEDNFGLGVFVSEQSEASLRRNIFDGWNENRINADQDPEILTSSLPAAHVGRAYSKQLEGIADTPMPDLSWSVIHGELPPGLALKPDGHITGTPRKEGKFSFTVRVHDSAADTSGLTRQDAAQDPADTSTREFTMTVEPGRVSLHVTKTASPDPAAAGQPITFTIRATNGGPDDAIGANVEDGLPAELSGATWTCTASGPRSSCPASGTGPVSHVPVDIEAGGSVTFTVRGILPAHMTGDIVNTASVTPGPGGRDPGCTPDCDASVTVPVGPALPLTGPDLMPEVTGGAGLLALGGLILLPTWRRKRPGASGFRSRPW